MMEDRENGLLAIFCHIKQYVSHIKAYRQLIWGCLCRTFVGSLSLSCWKLVTVSVTWGSAPFPVSIL